MEILHIHVVGIQYIGIKTVCEVFLIYINGIPNKIIIILIKTNNIIG